MPTDPPISEVRQKTAQQAKIAQLLKLLCTRRRPKLKPTRDLCSERAKNTCKVQNTFHSQYCFMK